MNEGNRHVTSAAMLDERLDSALKEYFHDQRADTAVPDFDRMLQRIEGEVRDGVSAGQRSVLQPHFSSLWRRWLNAPGLLAGAGALSLVLLAAWLVRPEEAASEIDAALFAQLERTTLWVAPSDRWLKPPASPFPGGLPDFSKMQFHMMEGLTWSDLDG